jgi:hypothetical protein
MLNKIIWTKTSSFKDYNQFEFKLPCGYSIYTSEDINISNENYTKVNLGVRIYSEEPITLIFTKSILSNDFLIIDPIQIIVPNSASDLFLNVINPIQKKDYEKWVLPKGSLIATMIPVNTSFTNLLEVNNNTFKQYG